MRQLKEFMHICEEINFPVSMTKTVWPTTTIVFLGLLLDTMNQLVMLPVEKVLKGRMLVEKLINKKKATIQEIQEICGFLNFLGRAIVPGRAFTRRLYTLVDNKQGKLKAHHHVKIKREHKLDLKMWQEFLYHLTWPCQGHSLILLRYSMQKKFSCFLMP